VYKKSWTNSAVRQVDEFNNRLLVFKQYGHRYCDSVVCSQTNNTHKRHAKTSSITNNYAGPHYRAEIYAGRVACCPLVNYDDRADWTDRQTDGQTDGGQTVTLCFPLDEASVTTQEDDAEHGGIAYAETVVGWDKLWVGCSGVRFFVQNERKKRGISKCSFIKVKVFV